MMYHKTNINLADAGSITLFNVQSISSGRSRESFHSTNIKVCSPYLRTGTFIRILILNFGMQRYYGFLGGSPFLSFKFNHG